MMDMMNEIEKIEELSTNAIETQQEIKLEKDVLEELKKEIKEQYYKQKEETLALDEEFDCIKIDGIILQERKSPTYTWEDDFYEEVINRGIAHTLLKHGDKLKERFDLSEFQIEKSIENKTLGLSPTKKNEKEVIIHNEKIESRKSEWINETLEQKVNRYMRLKKLIELRSNRYDAQKQQLLNVMKESGIDKTLDGFYLKDEPDQYDFTKLYNVELEETVMIATNGIKSVDLYNDKKIVEIEITEEDLYNTELIKKRFGQKRLEEIQKVLGEKFYYVKGNRKETEILKRFPVSTKDVEEAVDKGLLPHDILKTGRTIHSIDDLKLSFEIISEESASRRAEVGYAKYMERALRISGYYDSVNQ